VRLLIDTHVWLWMLATPGRLNDATLAAIKNQENEAVISVASAWEVAIKHALGKLPLSSTPSQLVDVSVRELKMSVPIALDHVLAAASLPPHHKDPFDRILVAQAQLEGLTLVTADTAIWKYGGAVLWAV
jgi:PIN domain nuclease of toxin-antitoxin system